MTQLIVCPPRRLLRLIDEQGGEIFDTPAFGDFLADYTGDIAELEALFKPEKK
jgi:hypothetical protein